MRPRRRRRASRRGPSEGVGPGRGVARLRVSHSDRLGPSARGRRDAPLARARRDASGPRRANQSKAPRIRVSIRSGVLARLHPRAARRAQRPHAAHYGGDISPRMVRRARRRCPRCFVEVVDAAALALPDGWPVSYDVVLVSDVLYYIPFAGVPQMVASENRNVAASKPWFAAVSRLARREVVFSSHQNNPWVRAMLRAARRAPLSPGGAWALAGTAP